MTTRYIVGIDGGGTKTQATIIDDRGVFYGTGISGASNFDVVGVEAARNSLRDAVAAAQYSAGLDSVSFSAAYLGLAGTVSSTDFRIVREMARQLSLAQYEYVGVNHDCRIALAGGLSGRPGIVLIVGTGSSCFGINQEGEEWRSGGWGHLISDEGSGYWLGIHAMRAAVASFDGRLESTALRDRILQHFNLAEMNDIMHRIYIPGLSKAEVAAIAPIVLEAARAGDAVSLALLDQATDALAECVLAVARRLGLTEGSSELVMVGGLLRGGDLFVNRLRDAVVRRLPQCRITWPELQPVLGACLLGLQLLEVRIDLMISENLRKGAQLQQAAEECFRE